MGTQSRLYIDMQNAYFGGNHAATHVHGVMTAAEGKSYITSGVRISGLCTRFSNTFFLWLHTRQLLRPRRVRTRTIIFQWKFSP